MSEEVKQRYCKITLNGGGSYIQPMDQLHNALDGELDGLDIGEERTLSFELVEMTKTEYESLPEFAGH